MKGILIDDESIALDVLEFMLAPYEFIEIVGCYTDYLDALEEIGKTKPNVIFLDIEMGEKNGLDVAEIFMEKLDQVEIVFVTAYSEYAVEAFEINAIDYLLKPIQEKRLLKTINRLKEKVKENKIKNKEKEKLDNKLEVYSFGEFQVLDKKGEALTWRTQKAKELFAYLWIDEKEMLSKDLILENIFPDRNLEKANNILHTTIYQLRKNLKDLGYENGIIYKNESYQLKLPIESDFEKFMQIIKLKEYKDEDMGKLLELYKGDFLEDGYYWAREDQEIYRKMFLKALETYSENKIKNNEFSIIAKIALDKAYEMDPFNEEIIETMIHYYGKQNKKIGLENFFNNYTKQLWIETDLRPEKTIVNIYGKYI